MEKTLSENNCPDCDKCLEILQSVADNQACIEEKDYFFAHIMDCPHCLECFELEKGLKDCIKMKLERKCVPIELLETIERFASKV